MNTLSLKLVILIILLSPLNLYANQSQNDDHFSARAYCQTTGGTITETGIRHIYICCYETKQKCIVNNEKFGYSRLIDFTHRTAEFHLAKKE